MGWDRLNKWSNVPRGRVSYIPWSGGKTIVIPSFTCKLSLVNGAAFITNPSIALTPYLDCKFTLNDGSKNLVGYSKAAGIGETYTDELVTDPGFDDTTKWAKSPGVTVAGGLGVFTNVDLYGVLRDEDVLTSPIGKLYKSVYNRVSLTAGSLYGYTNNLSYLLAAGVNTSYKTGTTSNTWAGFWAGTAGTSGTVDDCSVKQVLTPVAEGVTIVSARGGTAYNWTSDGGINPNSVSFTLTISII